MFRKADGLAQVDPELFAAIEAENRRQEEHIELIASENYVSYAVMQAQGSQLTNKYAEGYPGKRYYGGCEFVDVVENLAIERAKKLFGAEFANVQPHSGAQANTAVYFAMLEPGDTILGICNFEEMGPAMSAFVQRNAEGILRTWFDGRYQYLQVQKAPNGRVSEPMVIEYTDAPPYLALW